MTAVRISRDQVAQFLVRVLKYPEGYANNQAAHYYPSGAILTLLEHEGVRLSQPEGDLDPLGSFLLAARTALESAQSEALPWGSAYYAIARALEQMKEAEQCAEAERAEVVSRIIG